MARPRKPTEIKELAGTLQKCRTNPAEPAAIPGWPTAPRWLSKRAVAIFADTCRSMDGMGILSADWGDVIAAYAACQEEVELYSGILEDLGRVYTTTTQTGDTMFRPRPEVAMRSDAMKRAQTFRAELGLGPASKSRVSAGKKNESNPYAEED